MATPKTQPARHEPPQRPATRWVRRSPTPAAMRARCRGEVHARQHAGEGTRRPPRRGWPGPRRRGPADSNRAERLSATGNQQARKPATAKALQLKNPSQRSWPRAQKQDGQAQPRQKERTAPANRRRSPCGLRANGARDSAVIARIGSTQGMIPVRIQTANEGGTQTLDTG